MKDTLKYMLDGSKSKEMAEPEQSLREEVFDSQESVAAEKARQEWSNDEIQGMEQLYETLISVPISDKLNRYQVVSAYLQATCVAAEIVFNEDFYKEMLLKLAEQSAKGD